MAHVGVGWVMQGGVGHAGWGGSCRGGVGAHLGVGWVTQPHPCMTHSTPLVGF